ncbi:hypothetical protein PO903_17390 [Paenibacillus sp. PK4536]|uniref:Uncharacterized protein n=1 Tax=Paenibacillus nuruki TaxID=1886670 RepID=A0A1E3L5H9_9BACL|nr:MULTISPECIES: hypothetical protein [Paenibacillus]ODP28923.1 hypothetical protein PTI45_01702 [Paenibacillus nuruki]TKJ92824.1 hypothetical protein PaeCFBP13512_05575 [Paenibacillus sp. CFBP13512]WIM38407.1 hypothetical protein PO903_17390 [Paenibacillus sp. PK4536]CAJ1314902.1 Flagellar export chaperone FliS [Paenibacillus nuruki]
MIYFVRKNQVEKLPEGEAELNYCLKQLLENNEAILIDRMPEDLQMQSMHLLLSNPAFVMVNIQESVQERFIRSPLKGFSSDVYEESLLLVTSYVQDLQLEIEKGATALASYQKGEQEGMVRDGLRKALIDLGERREIMSIMLQEIRYRLSEQAKQEHTRATERFSGDEWNS